MRYSISDTWTTKGKTYRIYQIWLGDCWSSKFLQIEDDLGNWKTVFGFTNGDEND